MKALALALAATLLLVGSVAAAPSGHVVVTVASLAAGEFIDFTYTVDQPGAIKVRANWSGSPSAAATLEAVNFCSTSSYKPLGCSYPDVPVGTWRVLFDADTTLTNVRIVVDVP